MFNFLKIVFKYPSQRNAWRSLDFPSILVDYYSPKSSWRAFFQREKGNWYRTSNLRYKILNLGALSYFHVGTSSGGSGWKLGTFRGHGWVEHGSSQVIRLSIQRSDLFVNLLMLGNWMCKFWAIGIASPYRYEVLYFSIPLSSKFPVKIFKGFCYIFNPMSVIISHYDI